MKAGVVRGTAVPLKTRGHLEGVQCAGTTTVMLLKKARRRVARYNTEEARASVTWKGEGEI